MSAMSPAAGVVGSAASTYARMSSATPWASNSARATWSSPPPAQVSLPSVITTIAAFTQCFTGSICRIIRMNRRPTRTEP